MTFLVRKVLLLHFLGIVGLTAFVVTGGNVGCCNDALWCHRDDVVLAARLTTFLLRCYVYMSIVYNVHSLDLVDD